MNKPAVQLLIGIALLLWGGYLIYFDIMAPLGAAPFFIGFCLIVAGLVRMLTRDSKRGRLILIVLFCLVMSASHLWYLLLSDDLAAFRRSIRQSFGI